MEFLYDHTGVFAVKHNNATYFYRKDAQANIVALLDSNGSVVVKYGYDAWGNCKVLNASGLEITDDTHIGILNPFRYRSYYFDTETGFYFLKTRYYDPEIGRFMTIDDLSYLDPDSINGLNLYAYCGNNPVLNIDPTGHSFVAALVIFAIGSLISWGLSELFGAQIAGGISSIAGGGTAISTGISLCAFGPWGIAAGVVLMIAGGLTVAFGTNEIVSGITGNNYIRDAIGHNLYDGLYFGLNIFSSVGSLAGNIGMTYASNKILANVMQNPQAIQNYSRFQFETYARYSSQWTLKPSKNGKGMRALSNINTGNSIRYGYGINNAEHYFGDYYWIVANGFGKYRFPFIGR